MDTLFECSDYDRWLNAIPQSYSWPGGVLLAWAANSTLLGAVPLAGPLQRHRLDVCWHLHEQQADHSAEASHARQLLAGIANGDIVKHLSWGPCNGAAAVAELPEPLSRADYCRGLYYYPAIDHKLYVVHSGQGMASTTVPWADHGSLIWSPAGNRLLLISPGSFRLFTSRCVLVGMVDDAYVPRVALFSSDGVHIAACAGCKVALRLYNAHSGELVLAVGSKVEDEECQDALWDLSFNDQSDQLVLLGRKDVCITSFGWGTDTSRTSSRELCNAIAAVSSWTPD